MVGPSESPAELKELVEGLRDGVLTVPSRLGLQRANTFARATASAEWSLTAVLQAIADSARELLGARYAALGVVEGDEGRLVKFVHSGIDDDTAGRIGALPKGHGILGLLITGPLRLSNLGAHPASVGFPPGHPQMSAFLAVPILAGGEPFANLYLAEPVNGGKFSSEDEALAAVIAITASGAIANAQRLAESEQRRRWLAATAELSNRLLVGTIDEPLELIADAAVAAADADVVTITVCQSDGTIRSQAMSGPLASALKNTSWPASGTQTDQVIRDAKPVLVDESPATSIVGSDTGPTMVVPLVVGDHVRGALSLSRTANRPAFTLPELDMAAAFANQAALAMELIDARGDQVHLAVLEDKERIAEDLHDHVIQELFAAGMTLKGLVGRLDEPEHRQRVVSAMGSMDNVISRIRTTIFGLGPPPGGPPSPGLKAAILAVSSEHTSQLGYSPHVQFAGPLESAIPAALGDDIVAVTREALSNCARHAKASTVVISLQSTHDLVTLQISDNGRGVGQPDRSSGLTNMRRRAEHHRGTFTLTTPAGGGTRLTWIAPLSG